MASQRAHAVMPNTLWEKPPALPGRGLFRFLRLPSLRQWAAMRASPVRHMSAYRRKPTPETKTEKTPVGEHSPQRCGQRNSLGGRDAA